ncbi:DUF2490 domain-containing protein [Marinilabilia salmonicolor]|uniref:Uncharacterized protein DUF2490 n=1 Tax=Marinilabilia salmonicolor TaxID=989 RepID=A0A368UPI4_9BACT|nr:DUF2490 domain-containing protein [Marinilabilia salmonicolor]RCW30613.1 uncharacterized protein DUF2490 [Marinilabilia salmonicolor]
MRIKNNILWLTAFLLMYIPKLEAQGNEHIAHWTEIGAEIEIANDLELELSEELRYLIDEQEMDRCKTNLGLSYDVYKFLSIGAGYTWTYLNKYEDNQFFHRHRISGFIKIKKDLGPLEISLREKIQINYLNKEKENADYSPKNYLRTRFSITYNIPNSKLEPWIQAQIRHQLNNPVKNDMDNYRLAAGIEFPLTKHLQMDTFLQLDQEENKKNPEKTWIIGTNLKFEL